MAEGMLAVMTYDSGEAVDDAWVGVSGGCRGCGTTEGGWWCGNGGCRDCGEIAGCGVGC